MGEMLILTNNPLVLESRWIAPVEAVERLGLAAVLEAALEMTQSGCELVSTPLPPNVPLIRAPYRSLLLRRRGRRYDARGILALEKAGRAAASLGASDYGERPARDAAVIDREILLRTFRECGYDAPEDPAAKPPLPNF